MSKIEPRIAELLKANNMSQDSVWQHKQSGQWIVKHKALEVVAANAGITFEPPMIVESNLANKVMCICVTGKLKDRSEWSLGEATADNCKMGYYAAMAEKRAKDRVILKLLNLHGDLYSEEEADDFKEPVKKVTAKAKKERWIEIMAGFDELKGLEDLGHYWVSITDDLKTIKFENEEAFFKIEDRKNELKKLFNNGAYVNELQSV